MSDKLSLVRLVINQSINLAEIAKEVQWKCVFSDMSFKFVLILNDKRYKGKLTDKLIEKTINTHANF